MFLDRVTKLREKLAVVPAHKIIMSNWLEIDTLPNGNIPSEKIMIQESCNTIGCVAGWCCVLLPLPTKVEKDSLFTAYTAALVAQQQLGLSIAEADALFLGNWPIKSVGGLQMVTEVEGCGDEDCCPSGMTRGLDLFDFDQLKPSLRKKTILKVLDHIIENGFDWLPEEDRSKVYKRFDSRYINK